MAAVKSMCGLDVHLYLDGDGRLVITDKPREGLTPLGGSSDCTLDIPLGDAVTATVKIALSAIDVEIPAEQVRFVCCDERLTADVIRAAKLQVERESTLVQRVCGRASE